MIRNTVLVPKSIYSANHTGAAEDVGYRLTALLTSPSDRQDFLQRDNDRMGLSGVIFILLFGTFCVLHILINTADFTIGSQTV